MAKYRLLCRAIARGVWGPSRLSIIMAKKRHICKAIIRAVWGTL
jgi:hypothetical protein